MGFDRTSTTTWLVLALLTAPIAATGAADEAPCPNPREVDNVGTVCPGPDGLVRVLGPDGEELGTTHGHDPPPTDDDGSLVAPDVAAYPAPVDPYCVDIDSTPHVAKVIYATAFDGPDNYDARADDVRSMVRQANAVLLEEALEFDIPVLYRVGCTDGLIEVAEAVLPTPDAARSFSTVVSDLRDMGYNEYGTHYWVYYDQSGCSGGVGHIFGNDSPSVNNPSNGNAGAAFAVTFGCAGSTAARIMMHELGHNMGAVQLSAPNTSGGWHCNDGTDVMCYSDGGSKSNYDNGVCTDRRHFDCNHDDYFHPNPPPGSYLEDHWNLGSDVNRFIQKQTPIMDLMECVPTAMRPGETTTCEFFAATSGSDVHYVVDWDDGSSTRVPPSGKVAQGVVQAASHTYPQPDQYNVQVQAFNEDGVGSQLAIERVWVEICDMDEAGDLVVGVAHTGLYYVTIARSDAAVHPACPGEPFTLTAEGELDDFDVCFYASNIELACHANVGPESGTIPPETNRMTIRYQLGFDGTWRFRAGDAVTS